jgi:hypothetical protein
MTASTGVVLAVLQFAFALSWVIYVIYLPALAVQAGIPKHMVPWILLMDQAIFVACDWAAGVYADRVAAALSRIGPRIAAVTLASCAAFLLLPWIAPMGSVTAFIALTILWSATSSALRAPPLILIGRHAAAPKKPWLAGLYLLGLGIAGAIAPYMGTWLRDVDPRIPFATSTAVVALVTLVLARAERGMGGTTSTIKEREWRFKEISGLAIGAFAFAIALFAIGFQAHFSVNSAPAYLRFAQAKDLENLMPVFWIGFNLVMLPATLLAKRSGGLVVMAVAGIVGVVATWAASVAPSLDALIGIQLVVGGAWGTVLMSAFTAALAVGHPGREGAVTGALFSMLAVAAFTRIFFVSAEMPKIDWIAPILAAVPSLTWGVASLLVVALAVAGVDRSRG